MVISDQKGKMMDYQDMQTKVAEKYDHVHYFDVRLDLSDEKVNSLLADRNHLSREGNRKLGEILIEPIAHLLNLQLNESSEVPPPDTQPSMSKSVPEPQDVEVKSQGFTPDPAMIIEVAQPEKITILNPKMSDARTFVSNYVACKTVAAYREFKNAIMDGDSQKMTLLKESECIDPSPSTRGLIRKSQAEYIQVDFNHHGKQLQMWTESNALR